MSLVGVARTGLCARRSYGQSHGIARGVQAFVVRCLLG